MSLATQHFNLDLIPGKHPPHIKATQYDGGNDGWAFTAHLKFGDEPFTVPSGYTAQVEGSIDAQDIAFRVNATISNDTVSFSLTTGNIPIRGKWWCKILLKKGSSVLQTSGFVLDADPSGAQPDDVTRTSGFEDEVKQDVYDYLDEKQFPNYLPIDLIAGGNRIDKTEDGITFAWYPDKLACWVDGTNTNDEAPTAQYFAGSHTSFPGGIEPGEKYYVTVETTSVNAGLGFYFYKDDEYLSGQYFIADGVLDIPEDAEGMLAFVGVWSGQTVYHDVVSNIGVFRFETNEQLSNRLNNVSQFLQKSLLDGSYPIGFENKRLVSLAEQTFIPAKTQISSAPVHFDNRFLKITVDSGYTATVYYRDEQGTVTSRAMSEGVHFFYAGSNIPVVFSLAKTSAGVIVPSESAHLTVTDLDSETTVPLGGGIVQHPLEWEHGAGISYSALRYYTAENFWASAPIKLPKSGLRVGYNPKYHSLEYIPDLNADSYSYPSYKVSVVKKGDNGLVAQTDNADLLSVLNGTMHQRESVYIPYVEDAYAIITIYVPNEMRGNDYSDLLYVSSGEVNHAFCGVYNIFPTVLLVSKTETGFEGQNALRISGYETINNLASSLTYYATFLRLKDVRRIVCSPKYTLLAEIFKIENNGSITRHSDVYGTVPVKDTHTVATSGVSAIDFSGYDFDGFAIVAIQATSVYHAGGSDTYSVRRMTMGGLSKYEDVIANVCVEYKPGVNVSYVPGLPAIIQENIHKLMNWRVSEIGWGTYVEQGGTDPHAFPTQYDAVPSFYGGTYIANSFLMQVTAKSVLTCLKNRNGRIRKMQRESGSRGTIAFGITCTNMCSVLMGLKENYSSWSYAHQDKLKFDTYEFDYKHDLDKLRPGDVLTKWIPDPTVVGRENEAHCMMVESVVTVNGAVKAVNIIEAYIPFWRRRTYVDESYYINSDNRIINELNISNLEKYTWINRIKPEYLKPITETFDLYPIGTDAFAIMCDRGTESIYGEHTGYVELSFKDEDVESQIHIYKDGQLINSVYKSEATVVNGLYTVNVAQYLNGEGIYTIMRDDVPHVDEAFYIKGDVDPITLNRDGENIELIVPNISDLVFIELRYGNIESAEERANRKIPTYVPEEFEIDSETNTGSITVPATIGGYELASTHRIYDTPYGTYWADSTGKVSSDYYGLDFPIERLDLE